jgi:hypothetical protein
MDGFRRYGRQGALVLGLAALAISVAVLGAFVGHDDAPTTVRAGAAETATAAPAPVQDPCTLVTEAEAEAALGGHVARLAAGRTCTFTVTTGGAFRALSVVSGLENADAGNLADAVRTYAELAGAQLAPHAGVGDEAYATLDSRISQLIARSGERIVTVILLGVEAPPDQRITTMTDLARTALSRLA